MIITIIQPYMSHWNKVPEYTLMSCNNKVSYFDKHFAVMVAAAMVTDDDGKRSDLTVIDIFKYSR